MAHQRKLIRDAVKAALIGTAPGYATAAGARVESQRVFAWKENQLPAISVYTVEEPVDPSSRNTAPRTLKRNLQLAIECAVKAGTNVDDAIDALAEQVERAMHFDETFGGVCGDSILSATDIEVATEGGLLVGMCRLLYAVTYNTGAPEAEDLELDNFESAGIRTNLSNGQDVEDEPLNEVELPGPWAPSPPP